MSKVIEVFNEYNEALSTGDFAGVFATMADDVVWHQPGTHQFAGTFNGLNEVQNHLATLASNADKMEFNTIWASETDNLVTALVEFSSERKGKTIKMTEIDVFSIVDGKIKEVWLVDQDSTLEDDFWA